MRRVVSPMAHASRVPLAVAILLSCTTYSIRAEPIHVASVLINLLDEVSVPARQEGTLKELLVREGQLVDEGDVLAQIDDDEVRLLVQRAHLELEIAAKRTDEDFDLRTAQEEYRVAASDLQRANESKAKFDRSISAADLDRYQLQRSRAEIDIDRFKFDQEIAKLTMGLRENQLATAEKALERHSIKAPIRGVVVDVKRKRGEWVKPGDPLLRILRVDRLRADGYITADLIRGDLSMAPVTLVVDLPGKPNAKFPGRIVFVSPEVNPVDRKVRIWAEIENPGLVLKPGLSGDLTIE